MADLTETLHPGDWVAIYAQVLPFRPSSGHDEDVRLEVHSFGAQYGINVRRDRVRKIDPPPGIAERCTSLRPKDGDGHTYWRCTRHQGHSGKHSCPAYDWPDSDTGLGGWAPSGYIEER